MGAGFSFDKLLESQPVFSPAEHGTLENRVSGAVAWGELIDAETRDKSRQRSRQVMCFVLEVQAEA